MALRQYKSGNEMAKELKQEIAKLKNELSQYQKQLKIKESSRSTSHQAHHKKRQQPYKVTVICIGVP